MTAKIIPLLLCFFAKHAPCSCPDPFGWGVDKSKTVFIGEVISVREVKQPEYHATATFKVAAYIKGETEYDTVNVNVPCLGHACCGIPFKEKDRYLIYAIVSYDTLYTNLCSGSMKLPY